MGAAITSTDVVRRSSSREALHGASHDLAVASAQGEAALLLAVCSDGETRVRELGAVA